MSVERSFHLLAWRVWEPVGPSPAPGPGRMLSRRWPHRCTFVVVVPCTHHTALLELPPASPPSAPAATPPPPPPPQPYTLHGYTVHPHATRLDNVVRGCVVCGVSVTVISVRCVCGLWIRVSRANALMRRVDLITELTHPHHSTHHRNDFFTSSPPPHTTAHP